jgi:hypothetical protein
MQFNFNISQTVFAIACAIMLIDTANAYQIKVINKCTAVMTFVALKQLPPPSYVISPLSESYVLQPGSETSFTIPFNTLGVKISGHADDLDHYASQTLAEFGFADTWEGGPAAGTAYNLSLMPGSPEGLQIVPARTSCLPKTCLSPTNCPLDQGWIKLPMFTGRGGINDVILDTRSNFC